MNYKIWGILLIGILCLNLYNAGMGAYNITASYADDMDYVWFFLAVAFSIWMGYMLYYKWYPVYMEERQLKNWRDR